MRYAKLLCLALILLGVGGLAAAPTPKSVPPDLDPDGKVHGVSFGATAAQVREAFGPPTGSLQISESREALLYGKSHAFVFRKGRLVELHITDHLLDWELTPSMEDHPLFNADRWVLKPGIKNDMNFGEVARLLKKPNARPDYRLNYETEKAVVELNFSGRSDMRGKAEAYELSGVRIKSLAVQ